MKVRQPTAWHRVLALAPLLLVIVSLPGQVLLRCRMDGKIRSACCCPVEKEAAKALTTATLTDASCCDREVSSRQLPAVASTPKLSHSVDPSIPVPLAPSAGLAQQAPRPVPRELLRYGPARGGPPILVLKQTFLI
jgi:hypothetical protein